MSSLVRVQNLSKHFPVTAGFLHRTIGTIIVEILPANKLSVAPRHPYTKALADSVFMADPTARRETVPIAGEVPSPFNLPAGCVFGTRCPYVQSVCRDTAPTLIQIDENEYVACHFPLSD